MDLFQKGDGIWQPFWKDHTYSVLKTVLSCYTFDKHIDIPEVFSLCDEVCLN